MSEAVKEKAAAENVRLTERDISILHAVYTHRVLTTEQIERLFFYKLKESGRKSAAQRRLRKLYHNGYLARDEFETKPKDPSRPFLYLSTEQGIQVIKEAFPDEDISWDEERPKKNGFYMHEEDVNNVRVAIELACIKQGMNISKWKHSKELKTLMGGTPLTILNSKDKLEKRALIPDGYFTLEASKGKKLVFFIEADRATEVIEVNPDVDPRKKRSYRDNDFKTKIKLYEALSEMGKFRELFGLPLFRVLVVTKSDTRAQNLLKAAMSLEVDDIYYFTTFDKLNEDGLLQNPIWHVSDDVDGLEPML